MTTYNSADAIADIQAASYDSLKARFAALAHVIDAVGNERQALWDEIRRRDTEAAIHMRVSALGEDGKAALRSVLDEA